MKFKEDIQNKEEEENIEHAITTEKDVLLDTHRIDPQIQKRKLRKTCK
jgi:hypothetical protein